jgi:hypothetical protein
MTIHAKTRTSTCRAISSFVLFFLWLLFGLVFLLVYFVSHPYWAFSSRYRHRLFSRLSLKKKKKRNDFNQLVAEEYVKLFNFQGDTLDRALRKFVKQFTIIGEAQDRERVLHFFAARYLDCNPTTFTSVGQSIETNCSIAFVCQRWPLPF